jgi:NADH-quinone oxidoreductase subunit N
MNVFDVGRYYGGSWPALAPEIILTLGVVLLLVWEAFAPPEGLGKKPGQAAIAILGLAGISSQLVHGARATLFSGMLVVDPFTDYFRIFACVVGMLGALMALSSSEIGRKSSAEYFSLFLALVLGMILMAESSDILMIYIAIEIVSFMSYVLAGFRRHSRKGSEAALKYVIYGGAASGVMLFGFSLLYGLTGETQLSQINAAIGGITRDAARASLLGPSAAVPVAITAGLVLSFAGFAYKIAAVPLHMWSPDVYEGAPTPFTAFLSTGPKAAGFAALIRFFVVGFGSPAPAATNLLSEVTSLPWPTLLVVVSIVTMTLGNLAAIGQANIKRFLAYSSIAHAGYALIGVSAFSRNGAGSVLLYLAFYVLMNVGAFYAVIWVREKTGSEQIDDYEGLGYRAPFVAVALAVCLFSLTGLPPLAGFIGKWFLFAAAIDRGNAYPVVESCLPAAKAALPFSGKLLCAISGGAMYYWLSLIALLNSAVSLYYYARVVRKMFLERPAASETAPIPVAIAPRLVLGTISAALVLFGLIAWEPLWKASLNAIEFQRPTLAEIRPGATPSVKPATATAEASASAEAEAHAR